MDTVTENIYFYLTFTASAFSIKYKPSYQSLDNKQTKKSLCTFK